MDNPSINYNLRSGVMNTKCSVCGIDIGKDFSYYCVLDPSSQVYLKPFKANNDASGLKDAIRRLKKAEEALGTKPAIVLESTGHYSSRLVYFFIRNNFKVFLINPLQSHSIKNINIRKVKTDKIDCEEIARLFFILNLREYEMPNDEMANLKILTRSNYHLSQQRVQVVNQLRSEIDQVWPEFTKIFADIASKTVLSLLTAYPAPANLLAAPKKKIVALIMSNSRRGKNYALEKYKALQRCAKNALIFGTQLDGLFTCIELHVSILQQMNEKIEHLEIKINEFTIRIPAIKLLESIPGIGAKLAATIVAEIGDISRFKNAKQLVAYCGIDPSVKQSGSFTGTMNSFTKRGSPYVRRALYIAATVAIRKSSKGKCVNEVIYEYYQDKIKYKARKQALGAVMNKLVRIIFSVLKNERSFILITPVQQKELYAAGNMPAA
jgi:transposase